MLRSDYAAVQRDGLRVQSHEGDFTLPQVHCHRETSEIGPCDLVIVALKATANDLLLDLLPPLLREDTLILTLQNGLGSDDFLAQHFGSERVLGGLCFVCINRTAPGVIVHLAQGHIALGEHAGAPQERTRALAALLKSAGISCSVEQQLRTARWKKLVWNIPFNGLSIAAGGADTAAILADTVLEQRVRELMTEIIETATQLGHAMPAGLIENMIERTRTMAGYKPSSLIDFQAGREVEIDAIWAEPIRRAEQAGLRIPRVAALLAEIRQKVAAAAA